MIIKNSFNLIDDPWIPIVQVGKVSLKQLFTHSDYRCLEGNPVQKIALTKLLLAIAQAAYTPIDNDEWVCLKPTDVGKKCLTYLERWYDHFWLYGEKPFLQMRAIVSAKIRKLSDVLPEISTGNTTVLTQIQVEKPFTDADKALLIVSLMGFGLGGKKTDNSVVLSEGYQGKSNEKNKPSTGKPGSLMGHWGFMHSFLWGKSLLQTIWLNLLTHQTITERLKCTHGVGIPPWQQMPEGENCSMAQGLKNSLMGRLVPLSRFCLLSHKQEGLHYSEGIAYPSYRENGTIDPSISIDFSSDIPKVIWVDPEKRPWRYLTTLLSFIGQNKTGGFNCIQLEEGLKRVKDQFSQINIWSGGLRASGSTAGEQYVSGQDDFVESKFILESKFFDENWYDQFALEMQAIEYLSKIVYSGTFNFFKNQNIDGEKQANLSKNLFWQLCEREFQSLLLSCTDAEKLINIRRNFAEIVREVYDIFCPKHNSRQIESWAKCRPKISKYLSYRK